MQSWKECTWLEGLWVLFFTSLFLRLCGFVSICILSAHSADIAYRFIARQAHACKKQINFSQTRPFQKRTPPLPRCHLALQFCRLLHLVLHLRYLHTHRFLQPFTVKPPVALKKAVNAIRLPSTEPGWQQMSHDPLRRTAISMTQPKAYNCPLLGIPMFTGRLFKLEMGLCLSLKTQLARLPNITKKSHSNRLLEKLRTAFRGLKPLKLRFDKKQFAICLALLQPPWHYHPLLT